MADIDVLIIGAGPAGCATALSLAGRRSVLLIDRREGAMVRVGESLPAAACRILADLGVMAAFQAQGHAPCHGQLSRWGGQRLVERDALRDPYGPGWHLDRARFDALLRDEATARGARLLAPAELAGMVSTDGVWQVQLAGAGVVTARILVDAGGRTAPVARALGQRPLAEDGLACAWTHLPDQGQHPGMTLIEAEEEGWWYSAPLPGQRRILAFHTDADLPAARDVRDRAGLLSRAAKMGLMAPLLTRAGALDDLAGGFTAAHGARLAQPVGPGWFACGDAAGCFDPLSSQGLFNALYTGLAVGQAADRALSGDPAGAMAMHLDRMESIRAAYRAHLSAWYGLERRWPDNPFWARRRGDAGMG
ncbi:tryptophan 7-halogenase [Niveispirillum sp. BGYR6]|uniref:tryptophan 7-halogenase n=1 Tax=Niveispirillum sp. BGYR6 TaxID=2971249 RepID=UPI0022B9C2CD|nr:tryptophan 7-halogenase [Niveispirillum sp. BGYR6]MDG5493703.1 tryptophan 7-halogenase [Niveispirillum sp. BGYR6]